MGRPVGFTRPPVQEAFLEAEEVVTETLMVALPEKHRLRHRGEIALTDLADEPFLICSMSCEPGLHNLYLGLIQDAGFRPRVVQEAAHIQTQVGLVAAGVGICLVPSSAARLQQAGVVFRALSVPQKSLTKLMVWRKGPCPAHLTGFLGAVRQAANLLRSDVAIRRACRPAPEACFAIANSQYRSSECGLPHSALSRCSYSSAIDYRLFARSALTTRGSRRKSMVLRSSRLILSRTLVSQARVYPT